MVGKILSREIKMQMKSNFSLSIAKEILDSTSGYSLSEQFKSIDFLGCTDSDETTRLLIRAFESTNGQGIKSQFRNKLAQEQSEVVAKYAGEALTRRPSGVEFLCNVIGNSSINRAKRLLALSCFSKVESQKMVHTLAKIFESKDFEMIRMALKLIQQSEWVFDLSSLQVAFYNLSFFDDIPNDIASRAYGLFVRNISNKDIDEITSLIASTKDIESGERLLACLVDIQSHYAARKMTQLLGTDLREPAWYNTIASGLLRCECKQSQEVARSLCAVSLKDKLYAALNPYFRRRLIKRTMAAAKVAGNHLSAGLAAKALQIS